MPAGRLRLVFAGTPDFALAGLNACLGADADVVAVYTQPDRPTGRGRHPAASPVKQAARAAGISVEQPESLKTAEAQAGLRAYAPDLLVVIAYGLILPRAVRAIPRLGCWNVHASLLPRWRGAAPIQRAILAGDAETGVCLMQMEPGLDTGPVLLREITPIHADDTGGSLHDRLAEIGARVLGEGLRRVAAGELLAATPQAGSGATYAHKLEKAEARLDFMRPAAELARKVRAFDPWPVAEAELAGERVRVWQAETRDPGPGTRGSGSPGAIMDASKHGIDVACADGVLRILKLQRAGGRRVSAADYLNAHPALRIP
ncbi:MAG: methionyl-tRNA formyltransferase [Rhodanobacteraceae bacterium]